MNARSQITFTGTSPVHRLCGASSLRRPLYQRVLRCRLFLKIENVPTKWGHFQILRERLYKPDAAVFVVYPLSMTTMKIELIRCVQNLNQEFGSV